MTNDDNDRLTIKVYSTGRGRITVDFHPSVPCITNKDVLQVAIGIEKFLIRHGYIHVIRDEPYAGDNLDPLPFVDPKGK